MIQYYLKRVLPPCKQGFLIERMFVLKCYCALWSSWLGFLEFFFVSILLVFAVVCFRTSETHNHCGQENIIVKSSSRWIQVSQCGSNKLFLNLASRIDLLLSNLESWIRGVGLVGFNFFKNLESLSSKSLNSRFLFPDFFFQSWIVNLELKWLQSI